MTQVAMTQVEKLADELFAEWRHDPNAVTRAYAERPMEVALINAWISDLSKEERIAWCNRHRESVH